jgi:hypothetical protein
LGCSFLRIRNTDSRKKEERFINVFETWSWRGMLKIKWTDGIKNDEVLQRAKTERIALKTLKNRRHPAALKGRDDIRKKGRGKTWTAILKASRQKHRS